MSKVDILGVQVDGVTQDAALARMTAMVAEGCFHQVVTVNPEFVMRAQRDDTFRAVLNRADLAIADGMGIVWAARRLYGPGVVPERIAGVDTTERLAALAAGRGWRVFLLGAAEGVAAAAADVLCRRYPGLVVAGTYSGSPADAEAPDIIQRINAARTDILCVAYGAPAQDLWLARYRDALNIRLGIGVGGAFDFIAGKTQRAPVWMQRAGLEWLHRLLSQPRRWRRMLALPRFAALVLRQPRHGMMPPNAHTEPPHAR